MKKLSLEHPMFDGFINNTVWHRRSCLRMLAESKQTFETPFNRKCKQVCNAILGFMFIACLIVSTWIVADFFRYDHTYDMVMKQIYRGNAKQVDANKKAIVSKWKIAGAGDNTIQSKGNR